MAAGLAGCVQRAPPVVAPFSKEKLRDGLEKLRLAFEAKGHHVTKELLPPVSEKLLRELCPWFPAPLTEEIVALYGWRAGQRENTWDLDFPFWFRDCGFASLIESKRAYEQIMTHYGSYEPDRELLTNAFPIAEFNGGWLVVALNGHEGFERPVISVHEDVAVWFHSVNTMVDTCLEWVSHPSWKSGGTLPDSVEMEVWRKHNPGIFQR